MSNQVYSNFSERKLYRSSENTESQTMTSNQVIPTNIAYEAINFAALPEINGNYFYDPDLFKLFFYTEGVYTIGLTTSWFCTNNDGRLSHHMLLNGEEHPKLGQVSVKGYASPINEGPILTSNVTIKIKQNDELTFWCSGSNTGTQTLAGGSANHRTDFFISKLS